MRMLRRIAVAGAVAVALLGTALAGSAQAATGGGCSTPQKDVQSCSSWITGSGLSYNTYVNSWTYVHSGDTLYQALYYCQTASVATPSTSCTTFHLATDSGPERAINQLGLQPGGKAWAGSRTIHGIGYAIATVKHQGAILVQVSSPKVYW